MTASITGLKTWSTHEGGGYQASLLLDGRKVADVHNDGTGGALRWSVTRWEPFVAWAATHGVTLTPTQLVPCDTDIDIAVVDLINAVETERWLRRHCRTKTLFRLPEDGDGAYRTVKAPYSDKVRTFILATYPTAIIANEQIGAAQ